MQLTDTHCHLDLDHFDEDRVAVIERAEKAGLVRILIPALSVTSSLSIIKFAESHPMLYAAIGVQPNESLTWTEDTIEELRALALPHPQPLSRRERGVLPSPTGGGAGGEGKIIAIGEIGLDYYREAAPHEHQQRVFRAQLELATELDLPVVIHLREKGEQKTKTK